MTVNEFITATSKLEQYFDKEYTSEQRKIMFDMLKEWNVEKYIKSINYCIRNNKFLPKVADLINADTTTVNTQSGKAIELVKCNKCNDGFVRYFKQIANGNKTITYEYVALCDCENGKKQKEINRFNLPTVAEIGI